MTNVKFEHLPRPRSQAMDDMLGLGHPVLDHGFIRVIDYMGNDEAVTQAARVSYGKGTKSVNEDEGLIRYLMRHRHSTPFEMCEIKLHVKLPVFVARQWIRHRTANVNEYSARYSIMDREFYIPNPEDLQSQSKSNKQGRSGVLDGEEAERVLQYLCDDAARAYDHYEEMISTDNQDGLARELARMNLPTSIYTQWYWKTDLHNLFHFLGLRADSHAQFEIRQYAETLCRIVDSWVPKSYQAFVDYRLSACDFSQIEMRVLANWARFITASEDMERFRKELLGTGMSKREVDDFIKKLGIQ